MAPVIQPALLMSSTVVVPPFGSTYDGTGVSDAACAPPARAAAAAPIARSCSRLAWPVFGAHAPRCSRAAPELNLVICRPPSWSAHYMPNRIDCACAFNSGTNQSTDPETVQPPRGLLMVASR